MSMKSDQDLLLLERFSFDEIISGTLQWRIRNKLFFFMAKCDILYINVPKDVTLSYSHPPTHMKSPFQTSIQVHSGFKMGCLFSMVVVTKLPYMEIGPNYHREDAPHFSNLLWTKSYEYESLSWQIKGNLKISFEDIQNLKNISSWILLESINSTLILQFLFGSFGSKDVGPYKDLIIPQIPAFLIGKPRCVWKL